MEKIKSEIKKILFSQSVYSTTGIITLSIIIANSIIFSGFLFLLLMPWIIMMVVWDDIITPEEKIIELKEGSRYLGISYSDGDTVEFLISEKIEGFYRIEFADHSTKWMRINKLHNNFQIKELSKK